MIHLIVGVGVGDIEAVGGRERETITSKPSGGLPMRGERQHLAIPSGVENLRLLSVVAVTKPNGIRVTGTSDGELNLARPLTAVQPSADKQVALRFLFRFACGFHEWCAETPNV